jgi:hypothetical protein
MSRYAAFGPLDEPTAPVGDTGWRGVNLRLDPTQLPPGIASSGVNMRFRAGVAEPRKGMVMPTWINKIVGGIAQPWGEVHGAGVFSDPFTFQDYAIIAAGGQVWATTTCNAPRQLNLPPGVTLSGEVEFTQAFDVMIMHRGDSLPALQMPRVALGFQNIAQQDIGTGTQPIPNATHSVFFQNRVFVPNDKDEVAVSDFGDYTRYQPVRQEFRINTGSADKLAAIRRFNDTTLVAFKTNSIYVVNNVYGALGSIQQDQLTEQFGCLARNSIAQVGSDLWFLSHMGVMSIRQTEQNKLQGRVVPVSQAIQPLIDRINWRYASTAQAAYWDSKYYLAVPLDAAEMFGLELVPQGTGSITSVATVTIPTTAGASYRFTLGNGTSLVNGTDTYSVSRDFIAQGATIVINKPFGFPGPQMTSSLKRVYRGVNTAVLVYDFLNEEWAGYDMVDQFAVKRFLIFNYRDQPRLFAVDQDGWIRMQEEGYEDQLATPYVDILVTAQPTVGDTIRVNGGTLVTAVSGGNTPTGWGIATGAAGAADDLFMDGLFGFYRYAPVGFWNAPNTIQVQIPGGIRLIGTNGAVPTVVTTGSVWGTITPNKVAGVSQQFVTRGYTSPGFEIGDFDQLSVDIQTWDPNYSITVTGGGVEEKVVNQTNKTRSRTRYFRPHDAADFSGDNVNGDFLTQGREDYSIVPGAAGFYFGTGGCACELHQELREVYAVTARGRSAKVQITNSQGRLRVLGVKLNVREEPSYSGTKD